MNDYPLKVRESILPFSLAGTLPEAFREWSFTEDTIDHGDRIATCELCGKERIRYHFKIENENTHKNLWVGSHCILQFNVAVYEEGIRLSLEETERKLAKLKAMMQLESCIRALENLAEAENNKILRGALEYYRRKKKLTPKQAFVVFWRLRKNRIDHQPSFFSIDLRKNKYKDDLKRMETSKVHFFWAALRADQRQIAIEMGHQPPSS